MSPLADQLRPQNLDDFIGQEHLVGKNKPLRQVIETNQVHSMIFWGPPGCGKTTLARIIASSIGADFHQLSAVSAGKADIKRIIEDIGKISESNVLNLSKSVSSVLFLDEIHRFNKAQQDFLLPYVENGTITLIGATTENPSFEVISPLLSRCHVYVLESLTETDLSKIIDNMFSSPRFPLSTKEGARGSLDPETKGFLINYANGDARQLLNIIETTYNLYKKITLKNVKSALQSKFLRYDQVGEEHYNTISSFIKSMRASDVDAALYYLARMVNAGEDPIFIARRMVVFASEDVASPTALVVANAVFRACETVGYPECQENLAAGTAYLAQAPKDRRAYDAYMEALSDVKRYGNLPIPLNLRNAPTKLMKDLGYGKGYQAYTKDSLLPAQLKDKKYYK